jgi:peptide/nickel transport system permease protein
LLGPLVVTVLATVAGTGLALLAAWRGGWLDSVISRTFDLLFSFPGLLLAILAAATFGKGLAAAAIALAISYTPYMGRIVRGAATRQVALPYVTALRANGFGGLRVIAAHLLPNVRGLVTSQAAILFGYAMIDLAAVSFLGLGVQQPTPDWGAMVASGLPGILAGHPQEAIYASIAIVLTVACVNLLGERLGDRDEAS